MPKKTATSKKAPQSSTPTGTDASELMPGDASAPADLPVAATVDSSNPTVDRPVDLSVAATVDSSNPTGNISADIPVATTGNGSNPTVAITANTTVVTTANIAGDSSNPTVDSPHDLNPVTAPHIQVDPASPCPLEPLLQQLQQDLESLPLIDEPEQRTLFLQRIERRAMTVLAEYGDEGMEALLNLFQDYKGLQGIREAEAKPHYERFASLKSLAEETDATRRLIQRMVIGYMTQHPDQFATADGKLRATTLSYKVSVTQKSDRPLIINTDTRKAIESANQRLQKALTEPEEPVDFEMSGLFTQSLFQLLELLWPEYLPVPIEFLNINISIGLDEAAIRMQLEALEAGLSEGANEDEQILHEITKAQLDFAKLGEPSRWLTFSGLSRNSGLSRRKA
jgi:hypothetical protein